MKFKFSSFYIECEFQSLMFYLKQKMTKTGIEFSLYPNFPSAASLNSSVNLKRICNSFNYRLNIKTFCLKIF